MDLLLLLPEKLVDVLFAALDAVARRHVLVHQKVVQHLGPALVKVELVVEFGREVAQLADARPRDVGKVVVLDVVAGVVAEHVHDAIVRVRLLDGAKDVVLGQKVARERVERAGEDHAHAHVEERAKAEKVPHDKVKAKLGGKVYKVVEFHLGRADRHRAKRVEEDLEGAEEELGEKVVEQHAFELRGEIDIVAGDALEAVVIAVVVAEGDRHGEDQREVGDKADPAIEAMLGEGEVVANLVDGERQRVIRNGADSVG